MTESEKTEREKRTNVVNELNKLRHGLQQDLWREECWIPPFVDVADYKALDHEGIDHDLDDKAWAMYFAGKMEAYDHARQIILGEFADE